MIVPTLTAGESLEACVRSLAAQTLRELEIIVVDNSGQNLVAGLEAVREAGARVISNEQNVGFGAAVNQGIRASTAPFLATLNDDALAHPDCFAEMLKAMEARYEIGMCAPHIRLDGEHRLDSAGMLIARDGSSRQRGHGEPADRFRKPQQVLLPSGCAALYRRDMLDEIGLFDETFFLYCEDTDLGLRARWKLWECMYVPSAVVDHRYSHTAGRASALKAYYVERNRHYLVIKNFPLPALLAAPFFACARYLWHLLYLAKGRGKAAEYARDGSSAGSLVWVAVRALLATFAELPRLWRARREIQRHARATPKQFTRLLASHRISERQVAAL